MIRINSTILLLSLILVGGLKTLKARYRQIFTLIDEATKTTICIDKRDGKVDEIAAAILGTSFICSTPQLASFILWTDIMD